MNYNDFMQGIMTIKSLLSSLSISADEGQVRIVGQIHNVLNTLGDEFNNKIHNELMKKEAAASKE